MWWNDSKELAWLKRGQFCSRSAPSCFQFDLPSMSPKWSESWSRDLRSQKLSIQTNRGLWKVSRPIFEVSRGRPQVFRTSTYDVASLRTYQCRASNVWTLSKSICITVGCPESPHNLAWLSLHVLPSWSSPKSQWTRQDSSHPHLHSPPSAWVRSSASSYPSPVL